MGGSNRHSSTSPDLGNKPLSGKFCIVGNNDHGIHDSRYVSVLDDSYRGSGHVNRNDDHVHANRCGDGCLYDHHVGGHAIYHLDDRRGDVQNGYRGYDAARNDSRHVVFPRKHDCVHYLTEDLYVLWQNQPAIGPGPMS